MREMLIVSGLVCLAIGLRCSRKACLRKLGAVLFLGASFALFRFVFDSVWAGVCGAMLWFFLPWFELLTRIRRLRMPVDNRLERKAIPNPSFFPNASEATAAIEEEGFEHIADCGWEWDGMRQSFRLYWHPEERAVASICLCEQSYVAFAFLSVTAEDAQGRIWRTTNYPFASTLRHAPGVRWNHVPCHKNCFHQILDDHRGYLTRSGVDPAQLRMPDPDVIESSIEAEMRRQVEYNLATGIIRVTGDGHFVYSKRGLLFLWGQFVKDMVRFC